MRTRSTIAKSFQFRLSTLRSILTILMLLWLPLFSIFGITTNIATAETLQPTANSPILPENLACPPVHRGSYQNCVPPIWPIRPLPPKNTGPQPFWVSQSAGTTAKGGIEVRWQVSNEFTPLGFNIYRASRQSGPYTLVNRQPISDVPNLIQLSAAYSLVDPKGRAGDWYKIETVTNRLPVATQKPFQAVIHPLPRLAQNVAQSQPLGALENTLPKNVSPTILKFFITDDGVYRLTYNDLVSAGLDVSNVTGAQVDITTQGKAIQVATNTPGALNANSYFEFFGFGNRSPYSAESAYYITFDGKGSAIYPLNGPNFAPAWSALAARLRTRIITSGPNTYYTTSHFEQVNDYISTEPDSYHWAWDYVYNLAPNGPFSRDITFTLTNLPTNLDPNIQVSMTTGLVASYIYGSDPHSAAISVNGHVAAQNLNWTGNSAQSYTFSFPQNWLQNGTNTFTFATTSPPISDYTAPYDLIYLKSFDISYIANPVATNWIEGNFNPAVATTISGFSDSQVIAYDITDPTNPLRDVVTTVQQPNSSYNVTLGQSQSGLPVRARNRKYYLTGSSLTHSTANGNGVLGLAPDSPTNLKALNSKADYIIIAPSDFITQALTLANFHQTTYGQNTLVVNVADIYDLFNNGNFSPQAVKDFLTFAHTNWQTAPRWVLLFGNGSYNYRNYPDSNFLQPLAGPNYIPVHYSYGSTYPLGGSSDDWYVAGSDGITPYAAIGRLPAQNPAEATQVVNNIINYVQYVNTTTDTAWESQAAFVADVYDGSGNPLPQPSYFATDSDAIAQLVQSINNNFSVTRYYNAQTGDGLTAMNSGVSIINYIGHGYYSLWSNNDILTADMNSNFDKANQRPLSIQLTCETGGYSEVGNALSWEMVVAPNGGAIASIAASSDTDEQPDVTMGENVYKQILNPNTHLTLGEAMQGAMSATVALGSDYVNSAQFYTLIGDPAIYLAK